MFLYLTNKQKVGYVIAKTLILLSVILAIVLAFEITDTQFPTVESKIKFGIGGITILIIGVLAIFNRLQAIIKIRFIGFIVVFILGLLLREFIDIIIMTSGLLIVPLAIDDIFVENYFKIKIINKYGVRHDQIKTSITKD